MRDAAFVGAPGVVVDGNEFGRCEHPETPAEVAELLWQARERDEGVLPVGSGRHQRVGLAPERIDVGLSMARLSGVLRHDPEDLVLSVAAGTTLAEVQAVLGEHRQRLPVEAPGGEGATIGGLLALELNGPRQLGSPSLRELLLGMGVALTDGTVAKSGGMVVKNVSGFDMGRLHVGARGTLGVITSANFKVLPLAETDATVLAAFPSGRAGLEAALIASGAIRASALRPVACDILVDGTGTTLAVRFEGRVPGVRRQVGDVQRLLPGGSWVLDGDGESAGWWVDHLAGLGFQEGTVTAVRLDGRPREIGAVAAAVHGVTVRAGLPGWRIAVSPGLGQLWLHLTRTRDADVLALLGQVPKETATVGLLAASPAVRTVMADREDRTTRAVDQALWEQFDPTGVLNRGRFPLG